MAGEVASIEFRLLGPPEAVVGGRVVAIGSLQQRAILVALLLARNSVVSTDQLIDLGAAERVRAVLGEPSGPAFLLGETLATASERIRAHLGAEGFTQEKARGANLPIDEALAFVSGRLGGSG